MLPYLELKKDKESEIEEIETVTVPNIRNMTIKEAKKVLKEMNLNLELNIAEEAEIDEENSYIVEQTPKPEIKVNSNSNIFVDV